jgi:NAD(P)-dependent dehydrogenase (short-subunit alcohol dehydrogenase family)
MRVLVTGAGRSIGRATAQVLAERGHDVVATARDTDLLRDLKVAQVLTLVVPRWRERGSGVLVNISSVQGRIGTPLEGVYAASKHALEAWSESLHYELGHFGIRVVIVEPGYIAPGMKHTSDHTGPEVYRALHEQWNGTDDKLTGPGGRPGPELVGHAVADALEDPATPLRVEVGKDAAMVLALRRAQSDAEFEATMRQALHLTW